VKHLKLKINRRRKMIDTEFYMFWGSCLAVMGGFMAWFGILTLKQRKADRQRVQEAEDRKRRKALWDANVKEYADLFEGGAAK
jgi:hypothetical protein